MPKTASKPLRYPARARPLAYTRFQIALHWLVAALVLGQYAMSGAILRTHSMHSLGWRPSPTDLVLHTLHNRVGLTIILLMLGRLALRLWIGVPPPGHAAGGLAARLAQGVHLAFYAVLITEGVTGAIATYFWWPMSAAHVILFDVLLALVAIHVAAALWHEFVRNDAVMRRIGFRSFFGIGGQNSRDAPGAGAFGDADHEYRDMARDVRFLLGLVVAFAAISLAALWAGLPHHYMDELLLGMSIFSVFTVAGWWAVSSLWPRIGRNK